MINQCLLDVKEIIRDFGGVRAVNRLSFQVQKGEIVALIGPNGAGKSTVLNMISGVIPPSHGDIYFEGHPLSKAQSYQYARIGISRTFQNLQIFDDMTVLENVMVGFHSSTRSGILANGLKWRSSRKEEKMMHEQAYWLLELVGISAIADKQAGGVSYGKLRLMEIARALASQPKLLLLDEPAAGLNHSETAEMSKMFSKIRENDTSILLVEHDMDMVMNVADRIVVMDQGEKIAAGLPEEIQVNAKVITAYLGQEEDARIEVQA